MKQVVLASVCGFASLAAAQSGSFSIVPSVTTFDGYVNTAFTLSIYADADFGTNIAGGEFAIEALSGGDVITNITGTAEAWASLGENDRGYAGNGNHDGLVFGQLIFPPFIPAAAESALGNGGVLVATMTVSAPRTFSGYRVITFSATVGQGDFALEVFDEFDGSMTQLTGDQISFGTGTVIYPPNAPSGALLGIAGLVALRRRR